MTLDVEIYVGNQCKLRENTYSDYYSVVNRIVNKTELLTAVYHVHTKEKKKNSKEDVFIMQYIFVKPFKSAKLIFHVFLDFVLQTVLTN